MAKLCAGAGQIPTVPNYQCFSCATGRITCGENNLLCGIPDEPARRRPDDGRAPSDVSPKQLRELHIRVVKPDCRTGAFLFARNSPKIQ